MKIIKCKKMLKNGNKCNHHARVEGLCLTHFWIKQMRKKVFLK